MVKPEFQCPYRKEYFDPLYRSVYGEEFPGLQSDLLSNKARFMTAGKRDYPGLRIWTHANAAAVLRDRIGAVDKIIKGKFGGTLPAWLKESGGKNPGRNNPGVKAGQNKKYGNPFQSSSGKSGNNPGSKEDEKGDWEPSWFERNILGFCVPLSSKEEAKTIRGILGPSLLSEIGAVFGAGVKALWEIYLGEGDKEGGCGELELKSGFVTAFTEDPTTFWATFFLVRELYDKLERKTELWPAVGETKTLNLNTLIPDALKAVDNPEGGMSFGRFPGAPGAIAGGIGKDRAKIGAKASMKPDSRSAWGTANITQVELGILNVVPSIMYKVDDTVDFCPGAKGSIIAWHISVPFSRFEATGISGDVPFHVEFPMPEWGTLTIGSPRVNGTKKGGGKKSQGNNPGNPGPNKDLVNAPGNPTDLSREELNALMRKFRVTAGSILEGFTPPVPYTGTLPPSVPPADGAGEAMPESMRKVMLLYDGNSGNPGPDKGLVKPPANPGNPGVNPLGALAPGKSLGWSEEEVARRAVALTAAPAATPGRREVGGSPAAAGTTRNVTFYQTVDNVTINTGGPLDAQALRAALERFMRSEATAVA